MSSKNTNVRQIDVARKAGVSRACVSIVLNPSGSKTTNRISEPTAKKVRRIADQMGYRPNIAAQQLAGVRSRVIGLLLDGNYDAMPTSRLVKILFAMQRQAYEYGYRLLLANTYDDDQVRHYIEDFKSRGVEGVLCMHLSSARPTCNSLVSELAKMDRVVYFRKPFTTSKQSYVHVDYADGVAQAVAHLAAQGRKRIGMAVYSTKPEPMVARIAGYKAGLKAAGRKYEASLLWKGPHIGLPNPALIDGVIDQLVNTQKCDAIIASNDTWAVEIIKALHKRKLHVPDDVAIIGFDNIEDRATSVEPELTTIDHNDEKIGQAMVDLVLGKHSSAGFRRGQVDTIKPFLVVRDSA